MLKIYGASDDLIELEGSINDEHDCFDHKRPINILASDDTKATIFYNGEWNINLLFAGDRYIQKVNSVGDDNKHTEENAKGCTPYSDVLVLNEGIEWVRVGRKTYKP